MTIGLIRAFGVDSSFSDPASATLTGGAVTSGSTLLVAVPIPDTRIVGGMTGSDPNTPPTLNGSDAVAFTLDGYKRNQTGDGNIYFFRRDNITSGITSVSVDITTADVIAMFVEEISVTSHSTAIDLALTDVSGGFGTAVSIGYTTGAANTFAKIVTTSGSDAALTGTGGYTAENITGVAQNGLYLTDTGTAGAKTATGTFASSVGWIGKVITYAESGGGGGPTSYYLSDTFEM